ncbi:unnamed protein product, partial [Gulo gulo]
MGGGVGGDVKKPRDPTGPPDLPHPDRAWLTEALRKTAVSQSVTRRINTTLFKK